MNKKSFVSGTVWLGVFCFRLLPPPFRIPNVEPLLASVMPVSARTPLWAGILFAMSGIVVYDVITSGVGVWTLVTAGAFGLIATASHFYFSTKRQTRAHFVGFGIASTLWYDAVTGLTIGPIFWHQSLMQAIAGQIPFTLLHLIGTTLFAIVLSPAIIALFDRITEPFPKASHVFVRTPLR